MLAQCRHAPHVLVEPYNPAYASVANEKHHFARTVAELAHASAPGDGRDTSPGARRRSDGGRRRRRGRRRSASSGSREVNTGSGDGSSIGTISSSPKAEEPPAKTLDQQPSAGAAGGGGAPSGSSPSASSPVANRQPAAAPADGGGVPLTAAAERGADNDDVAMALPVTCCWLPASFAPRMSDFKGSVAGGDDGAARQQSAPQLTARSAGAAAVAAAAAAATPARPPPPPPTTTMTTTTVAAATPAGEAAAATAGAAESPWRMSSYRRRQPRPAILVVTHREGLRDVGLLTAEPFMKTFYCAVALFGHQRERGWSTRYSPEEFQRLQGKTALPQLCV
jgi:hypothetical protein